MRVLEEFSCRNIELADDDFSACKERKETLRLITRNEEDFQAAITDEQKKPFSRYTNTVREYQTMAEFLLFRNSFRLCARMMVEIMDE